MVTSFQGEQEEKGVNREFAEEERALPLPGEEGKEHA
jgi:hypothetical protein